MAAADPNVTALNNYRLQWAQRAVTSAMINPRFFPTYAAIMNIPLPQANMTSEQFVNSANQLATAIKIWYTNARYRGNLAVLANEIDNSRPKYSGAGAEAGRAPATDTPAPCPPDPSPQTLTIANRFFKSERGVPATVNFAGEFENYKVLSDADVTDITNLLNTSTSTANFNSIVDRLQSEKRRLEDEIAERRIKAEAINQQFVEERDAAGKVKKSKVMVLQDYILAGFAITFLFFAIVVIFYFTKQSLKPMRTFITLVTLMVIVAAILYTWTSHLA